MRNEVSIAVLGGPVSNERLSMGTLSGSRLMHALELVSCDGFPKRTIGRLPIVMLRFAGLGERASRLETQKYRDRENVYAHHYILCSTGAFDREHPDFADTSETFDEVLTSAVRAHLETGPRRGRKTCSVL